QAHKRWLAEDFAGVMSSEKGVRVLPYAKDASNAQMAMTFSDSETLMFSIPDGSYAISLELPKLVRVNGRATAAERTLVYGSFLIARLSVAGETKQICEIKEKLGLPKIIAASQTTIADEAAYRETTRSLVRKAVDKLCRDRKGRRALLKCGLKRR
ncbi:MAG: hypothetical protein ACYTG5_17960, partial [Planctomycetota bacterium]